MKFSYILGLGLAVLFFIGCSGQDQPQSAIVKGTITVADSVDSSGDYSGIGVTIIKKDSANADADTLFHQLTDSTGTFSGIASFPAKNRYPLFVSRNGRNLGSAAVILANQDTVQIEAELPDFQGTLNIESHEHKALQTFQRVDRGFNRIAQYIGVGRLKGDTLQMELNKWSNLYWQVHEEYEGTIASGLAASEAVKLLQGWNNSEMMRRIRSVQDDDQLVGLAATYGKNYLAENHGLDYAVSYLDTLQRNTEDKSMKMRIQMERIKLLYDSARVAEAKEQLADFKENYQDRKEVKDWTEAISYDLNYLSPGDTIPSFSFELNGRTISRDSLMGTPYVLEITTLSNRLYQQQFDRTVVIHSIYKNFGLQVVTLPLDESQQTINGFFEERMQPWPVAPAKAFDRQELVDRFNIKLVPTRFLIDREGKIVRKYVGREFEDVIKGIQSLTQNEEEPAS